MMTGSFFDGTDGVLSKLDVLEIRHAGAVAERLRRKDASWTDCQELQRIVEQTAQDVLNERRRRGMAYSRDALRVALRRHQYPHSFGGAR